MVLLWITFHAMIPAITWRMHVSQKDHRLSDDLRIVANGTLFPAVGRARTELNRFDGVGHPFVMHFNDAVTGQPFDIEKHEGQIVLIDFWATWCDPCLANIPHLRDIQRKYGPKGVVVVGVSLDDSKEKLLDVVKREDITWPQFFDATLKSHGWSAPFATSWGIYELPSAFLVDRDGNLVDADVNLNSADDEIQDLLNGRPVED